MDPNATLQSLRQLAINMIEAYENLDGIDQDEAYQLAELVQSMDEWITKGGFLPEQWKVRQ